MATQEELDRKFLLSATTTRETPNWMMVPVHIMHGDSVV